MLAALWLATGSGATAQTVSGLQNVLDAEFARFPGRAGVWVKHLATSAEASVRGDD